MTIGPELAIRRTAAILSGNRKQQYYIE